MRLEDRARRRELDDLTREIEAIVRELSPQFPDIDPIVLVHIVEAHLRPFGTGRRFLLRDVGGVHVP